jgi:hypothetical protein
MNQLDEDHPLSMAFNLLERQLRELAGALAGLRVTICEDAPRAGRPAFAADLCAAVIDAISQLRKGLTARAGGDWDDATSIGAVLFSLGPPLNAVTDLLCGTAHRDRLAELASTPGTPGGEWTAWAASAAEGLEEISASIRAIKATLSRCWSYIEDPGVADIERKWEICDRY